MTARSRLQTIVPILLMVVLAAVVTNVFPFRQMIAQDKTVDLAQERLFALQSENARLERDVEALSSDTELERLARSDLGYVRPGETAYVVTAPSQPVSEPIAEAALPEATPWYHAIWGFLTGEDLVER